MVIMVRVDNLHAMFVWRVVMARLTPGWRWNAAMTGLVWGTGGGRRGGRPSVMKLWSTPATGGEL